MIFMYENGRRIDGYRKKRLHKRKLKRRYAKKYYLGDHETDWNTLAIRYENRWGSSPEYWKDNYLSGPRKYARRSTSRKIRSQFKSDISKCKDFEDHSPAIHHGKYRKYFDYDWTIW